jgi:exonuclease SbcC
MASAKEELNNRTAEETSIQEELRTLSANQDEIAKELGRLHRRRDSAREKAKLRPMLDAAEARLDELRKSEEKLQEDLREVERKREAMGEPVVAPAYVGSDAEEGDLQRVERMLSDWRADVKVCESKVKEARAGAEKLAKLRDEQAGLEANLADWTKLAQDLGRDGLQAMEVDSAGGELTELTNDLLHTCLGPRWTVAIETQRLDSKGKKTIEGCDVMVVDTVTGRYGTAASLSGGEKVLVGEAVSLALSMLACRRAGVTGATLVRDETGAALDPENAIGYVAMLRRAAELVDASKVLFVSHNPDARDLADAIVWVKDGKIEVQA